MTYADAMGGSFQVWLLTCWATLITLAIIAIGILLGFLSGLIKGSISEEPKVTKKDDYVVIEFPNKKDNSF